MANDALDRFNKAAATWDEVPARRAIALAVSEAIRRAAPLDPDMQAMDFGCGTGLVSLALQPYVAHILAVDFSPQMIAALAGKLSAAGIANVEASCLDITHEPLDRRFDLIFRSMALHHIEDPQALIATLAAALEPGGHLCLADLDAEDGSFHPDMKGVYHLGFSAEQMQGMYAAAGLVDVRVAVAHTIVRPTAEGEMRGYPVLLTVGRMTRA